MPSLREALDSVPDPRSRHGRRHPLGAILTLVVAAMLCGARSVYAIAQWGRDQGAPVAWRLGFTRTQTPDPATIHRVFRRLDREAFEGTLSQWFQEQGVEPGEALAMDGKRLRGIQGDAVPGVHLVAAYGQRSGVVAGQVAVNQKRNELEAAARLLDLLPLEGRVVTGDAQFAQRDLSHHVVTKGGTTSGS